jgi:hypothetical protein
MMRGFIACERIGEREMIAYATGGDYFPTQGHDEHRNNTEALQIENPLPCVSIGKPNR